MCVHLGIYSASLHVCMHGGGGHVPTKLYMHGLKYRSSQCIPCSLLTNYTNVSALQSSCISFPFLSLPSFSIAHWSIRKEALESILPLASKPKLAPGDYTELIKTLTKVNCALYLPDVRYIERVWRMYCKMYVRCACTSLITRLTLYPIALTA